MSPWEVLLIAGGGAGAFTALAGVLWWLAWPRIEDKLEQLSEQARNNAKQLQPGGQVHDYAATAATAARELPALRQQIETIAEHGSRLAQETAARVTVLEAWRPQVDRRLGVTEQSLLALLGPELIARLRIDLNLDEALRKDPTNEP